MLSSRVLLPPVVRAVLVSVLGVAGLACDPPEDRLFEPEAVMPAEVQPGLFRVTWSEGRDVVRGFTPDGRILYLSADALRPDVERLLSVSPDDGATREEAGLYRASLLQPVVNLAFHEGRRLLTVRSPGLVGLHTCGGCPAPPTVVGLTLRLLEAADGEALSSLPQLVQDVPVDTGSGTSRPFIRVTPAEQEARVYGVDPFRPALLPDGFTSYFSDGESVFRFDAATPSTADSVLRGAFVAASADGALLAVSEPVNTDSTGSLCMAGLDCQQTTIVISATGWETTVYDASSLAVVAGPFPGIEPVFDPLGGRLLVRRFDGLYWITLSTGAEELIEQSSGGVGAALSPDGSVLAYSLNLFGNADVFFLRL